MNTAALENLHDHIFFEIITDLAFLPSELKEKFNQSVDYANIRICEIDRKIEELEQNIFSISADYRENWLTRLQELKEKRKDLLVKTRAEIDKQKIKFQIWVDGTEEKTGQYKKKDVEEQIFYHTKRIEDLKQKIIS
ncbi:hypothetical protein GCM10022217_25520 [Chryseobacterium ginsenosidimutans]|uniref:hypothetical protein n=1 Tax=Chryseobacterium ginsenosidimutans TaxID=687846 RepID=UPI0031DBB870